MMSEKCHWTQDATDDNWRLECTACKINAWIYWDSGVLSRFVTCPICRKEIEYVKREKI